MYVCCYGGLGVREDVALRGVHIAKLEGSVDQNVDAVTVKMSQAPPRFLVTSHVETSEDVEDDEMADNNNI